MKPLILFLLLACGRSECADYCVATCQKSIACDAPAGARAASATACEEACEKGVEANRLTDDQCRTAREKFAAMSCATFRAFLVANGR